MTYLSTRRWALVPAIVFASGVLAACGGSDSAPKAPLAKAAADSSAKAREAAHALLGPEAKIALDSGNAMFRRKDYKNALAKYREASSLAPQHSAPLFGVYMAARAMNNPALADSAIAGIRARNGDISTGLGGAPHGTSDSALKDLRAQMKKGAKTS